MTIKKDHITRTRSAQTNKADSLIKRILLSIGFVLCTGNALADRTMTSTYYPNGLLHTVDGPRSPSDAGESISNEDLTTYEYTSEGYLTRITNALGHQTQLLDHNSRGNPGRLIDANGVETLLTYHPRGYLETSTIVSTAGNLTTTFGYDAAGNVQSITLPDGSLLTYEYDAAQRLEAISNNLGERIEYTLDAAGNRTREDIKDAGGTIVYTHQMAFDELSRLMDNTGSNGQNTHIDYDVNDNPTTETDAESNTTARAFDALNRLKTLTDAKSNDVGYSYDDQDRIKTVTDQNGNVTTYNYNEYGDLTSLVSQATGTTNFEYDDAGNVMKRTDARGAVTDYQYDELNRLTMVMYPGNAQENVNYGYDDTTAGNNGVGRLTSIVNSDASLSFVYDDRGNTTEVIQAVSGQFYSTQYDYDVADNISDVLYPSGRIVTYQRDITGQVTGIVTNASGGAQTETVVSAGTYKPFGPMSAMQYGNGLTMTATYDLDYRLETLTTGSAQNKVYSYDLANNITAITDNADPLKTQSFSYDELYYLSQDTGQYGSISYDYDAAGNRIEKTTSLPEAVSSDNLVFNYNQANRMSSVEKNGILLAGYKYNALGQRVEKVRTDDGSTTVYFYDLTGQVIGERITDSSGIVTDREYVWLNSKPVAMFVNEDVGGANDRSTVFIHTDHLNTPRLATDSTQQIVWRWDSDAFGVGEASEDPDGNGTDTAISLRFPGQLKDNETRLHYNYFRDYDSRIGRYFQPDPIGLEGGENLYLYVENDAINFFDLLGLARGGVHDHGSRSNAGLNQTCKDKCVNDLIVSFAFELLAGATPVTRGARQVIFLGAKAAGMTGLQVGNALSTSACFAKCDEEECQQN